MTCIKNSVLLMFMGIVLQGLGGCQTQAYKPWQPGNSWWENDQQPAAETAEVKVAEPAPMQASPPPVAVEPAPEAAPAMHDMPQHDVSEPTPPPMMVRDEEPPLASKHAPAGTTGDVLLMETIRNAPAVDKPRNGMTMTNVRSQFGNPISEGSSIGDPPITRWEYNGFSVYFERDLVLHTVTHRPNRN